MKTRKRFTEDSYRKEPWFRALCDALLSCKSEQEIADFLRDIGTLSELQAWGERLEVAKHLAKGLSYRDIATVTGASTTTVTRVAKFIENGPGGYRRYLNVHRHHRMGAQPISRAPILESGSSIPSNIQSGSSTRGAGERASEAQNDQKMNVESSSHNPSETQNGQKNISVLQKYLDRK
jgi:TrpR-related protein YerC/YecD